MRDPIERQDAIDVLHGYFDGMLETDTVCPADIYGLFECIPSAQPERTCVNCGRTVNNGGWYADGGTRCPIEEHYALPKDGYCHLWEKRKVWEDDYVKRPEEGEK